MRFIDERGSTLNIYQQNTQLVDEHMIQMPWGMGGSNIGGDAAVEVSRQMFESLETAPAALAAQFHIDPFIYGDDVKPQVEQWLTGTLELAAQMDIPVWSAEQWLNYTQMRLKTGLKELAWNGSTGQLDFNCVIQGPSDGEMTIILPMDFQGKHLAQISFNGKPITLKILKLHNLAWAWCSLPIGLSTITATYL